MKAYCLAAVTMAVLLIIFPIFSSELVAGTPLSPVMDGEITEGEYEHSADLSGDFLLCWQVYDDTIFFAMSAITDGYLAVGFDPEFLMKGADMVVGWVNGTGNAIVIDAYSTGQFGPVVQDIDQGGTDDILASAGTVQEGWTTIEFSRALITGDQYDKDIPLLGEFVLMWAVGSVFDPSIMPEDGGMGTISISSGASSESMPARSYLVALALAALAATILASLALLGPASFRTKLHLMLGAVSAVLMGCATLIVVLYSVIQTALGPSWLVLVATVLVVSAVLMGAAARRGGGRPWLKRGHVLFAAVAMAGLVWCILSILWV